jgi:FtsZ-binding cell division protein ZapB
VAAAPVRTVDLESPEGLATAIDGMLRDYASKKVENNQLRQANAELAEANARLKEEHAADREQLENIRATLKNLGLT